MITGFIRGTLLPPKKSSLRNIDDSSFSFNDLPSTEEAVIGVSLLILQNSLSAMIAQVNH